MLNQCLESLVQKVQSGVVINFEKSGPDPAPIGEGIVTILVFSSNIQEEMFCVHANVLKCLQCPSYQLFTVVYRMDQMPNKF